MIYNKPHISAGLIFYIQKRAGFEEMCECGTTYGYQLVSNSVAVFRLSWLIQAWWRKYASVKDSFPLLRKYVLMLITDLYYYLMIWLIHVYLPKSL